MRRVTILLAGVFGVVAAMGFGAGVAEAKGIKLSTMTGAFVAKKALTAATKKKDGSDASASDNAPTSAEDEARAAAMAQAKAKLEAEKRTETAVEVTSAVLPPNTGVVCLAGCMRAR